MTSDPREPRDQRAEGAGTDPADRSTAANPTADDLVTTHHSITIEGGELRYTATPGGSCCGRKRTPTTSSTARKPKAEVFVIAYTLDGADAASGR